MYSKKAMVQRVSNKLIDLVISKLNQSNVCMGGDENPLFAFLRLLMIGSTYLSKITLPVCYKTSDWVSISQPRSLYKPLTTLH